MCLTILKKTCVLISKNCGGEEPVSRKELYKKKIVVSKDGEEPVSQKELYKKKIAKNYETDKKRRDEVEKYNSDVGARGD